MNSKIFTNKETAVLQQRLGGDKTDRTGVWTSRIKPKIKEILEVWLPKKKELEEQMRGKEK